MTDYFFPVFENLGEQPVQNKEIRANGTDQDGDTFGFQEYGYEYRHKISKVTGEFNSFAKGTRDI